MLCLSAGGQSLRSGCWQGDVLGRSQAETCPGSWRVQELLAASSQSGPLPLLPTPSSYQDMVVSCGAHPEKSPRAHLNILTSICKCSFPKEGPIHRFWGFGCGSTFWGCGPPSGEPAQSVVGDPMPRTPVHRVQGDWPSGCPGCFLPPWWVGPWPLDLWGSGASRWMLAGGWVLCKPDTRPAAMTPGFLEALGQVHGRGPGPHVPHARSTES